MDLNVIKEVLNRDRGFMARVYHDTHGVVWFAKYQEISEKYKDRTIEEIFNLYNSIVPVDDDSELFKAVLYDYLDDIYNKIKEENNIENKEFKVDVNLVRKVSKEVVEAANDLLEKLNNMYPTIDDKITYAKNMKDAVLKVLASKTSYGTDSYVNSPKVRIAYKEMNGLIEGDYLKYDYSKTAEENFLEFFNKTLVYALCIPKLTLGSPAAKTHKTSMILYANELACIVEESRNNQLIYNPIKSMTLNDVEAGLDIVERNFEEIVTCIVDASHQSKEIVLDQLDDAYTEFKFIHMCEIELDMERALALYARLQHEYIHVNHYDYAMRASYIQAILDLLYYFKEELEEKENEDKTGKDSDIKKESNSAIPNFIDIVINGLDDDDF